MHIIVGVLVFGLIAFLWIAGHLFGRILMFLAVAGMAWVMSLITIPGYSEVYLLFGLPVAWIVASAPTWLWGDLNAT